MFQRDERLSLHRRSAAAALDEIARLMDPPEGRPEEARLGVLATLVEPSERQNFLMTENTT